MTHPALMPKFNLTPEEFEERKAAVRLKHYIDKLKEKGPMVQLDSRVAPTVMVGRGIRVGKNDLRVLMI